jgi:adenylate cyclase
MSVALAIRSAITGDTGHEGLIAADRALALDASIAEAHAAKGRLLANREDFEGAWKEFEVALGLDPNSYETNMMAGVVCTGQNRFREAIGFFEKGAELSETNYGPFGFLVGAYISLGDKENARSSAKLTLVRAQPLLSLEPDNGAAMGYVALSLAVLGESERFKEMISRGMTLDPNNFIMTFNFLRGLIQLEDIDAAIDMLQSLLQEPVARMLNTLERSAEFSALRTNARYSAIVEAAKATLAAKAPTALPPS